MAKRLGAGDPEPGRGKSVAMAIFQPFQCQFQRSIVLRPGPRRAPPERAGKLVQKDDEGKSALGIGQPIIAPAGRRTGGQRGDCVVRPAMYPPFPMAPMACLMKIRLPGDWKPLPATPFMAGSGGGWIVAGLVVMDRSRG